jgi:hypothetical protein
VVNKLKIGGGQEMGSYDDLALLRVANCFRAGCCAYDGVHFVRSWYIATVELGAAAVDNEEAARVLAQELTQYRRETYANLQRLLKDVDAYEVVGPSGAKYQVEIQAVWDDKPNGNLRVMGGIDDGGVAGRSCL